MIAAFYGFGALALAATAMAITRRIAVHALLYLVVSFLALAGVMFALGAPFLAALEVIVYAGAIVVLFLFVVMVLNIGTPADRQEENALSPRLWLGPSLLAGGTLAILLTSILSQPGEIQGEVLDTAAVAKSLFGPYVLAVELSTFLLLASMIAAFHLGRHREES